MKNVKYARFMAFLIAILALQLVCGGVYAQSGNKSPIKLGIISEWDFAAGQGIKRGAELAIRDINKAGGLLGRKLEGIYYDNKANADEAKKATERLLYMDKVDAITGFWRSDLAIVVQPLIMEANKIMMIGGAASPVLTTVRIAQNYDLYKNTFVVQTSTMSEFEIHAIGIPKGFKLGLDKIAVMVEKAAWADPLYDDIMKRFKKNIVYSTRFSPTTTDFQIEFAKAKAAGANNLIVHSTGTSGTPAVKQWYDMQLPMLYTGQTIEAQSGDFWKITEGKAEGVVTTLGCAGGAGFPATAKSRPWFNDYIKTYGEKPVAYTNGFQYDAVMVWAKAVKMAGTTETNAVRNALLSKNFNYTGICGQIDGFDKIHNPFGGDWIEGGPWGHIVVQWQNGEQKIIWPDSGIKGLKANQMIIPKRVKDLMKSGNK